MKALNIPFTAAVFVWLMVRGVSAAVDTNYTRGIQLYSGGNYEAAEKKLALAYKVKPKDAYVAFAYAMVAPCSLSVAIFTKCAADTTVPDSLRAAAYGQLGDYSFVHSAFKTAAEKYRRASSVRSEARYRHRWAMAAAALHDMATARSLWQTMILEHGTDLALQAYYHLALIDMEEGGYDSAYAKLGKCGEPDSTRSWTVAATAAKLECAIKLGKTDAAKKLEKKLKPYGELLLERDLPALSGLRSGKKTAAGTASSSRPDGPQAEQEEYTLQVGAFGSIDNATALQKKLGNTYGEVTILPVTLSDQVFYRVRVGVFKSKDAAEKFGNNSLATAGIAFKAVVK
jgi:tetratricopeptide (TPR) repeat protein